MPEIQACSEVDGLPSISPAKNYIPSWYPKTSLSVQNDKMETSPAVKSCFPFRDSFSTGYMAELWEDIVVEQGVGGSRVKFLQDPEDPNFYPAITVRGPEFTNPMPAPNGYENKHYTWNNPYLIKAPKGYSLLITQPLNQYDTPFMTLSAIVDCDEDLLGSGRIPFYIKDGFKGLVKKGTPIFQIIPIKREDWNLEENTGLRKDNIVRLDNVESSGGGWYKKNLWKRKEYK